MTCVYEVTLNGSVNDSINEETMDVTIDVNIREQSGWKSKVEVFAVCVKDVVWVATSTAVLTILPYFLMQRFTK